MSAVADQEERRTRILQAATALASEGGYDAVQMRAVAASAQVALGTLYRYFPSKDRLLSAAMADWARRLRERMAEHPPTGDTLADQIVDLLRTVCESLESDPALTAALISAVGSRDPGVTENLASVTAHVFAVASEILSDLDDQTRLDVLSVTGHVLYSALISWNQGRRDFAYVYRELERAVRLLLTPFERSASVPGK